MSELLQMITGLLAVPTMAGYACRLGALDIRRHNLAVCLMHAALMGGCAGVAYRAAKLQAGLPDLLCLVGAALWLAISVGTWRDGVPDHFVRDQP